MRECRAITTAPASTQPAPSPLPERSPSRDSGSGGEAACQVSQDNSGLTAKCCTSDAPHVLMQFVQVALPHAMCVSCHTAGQPQLWSSLLPAAAVCCRMHEHQLLLQHQHRRSCLRPCFQRTGAGVGELPASCVDFCDVDSAALCSGWEGG